MNDGSLGTYASRISRCTAERCVPAISSSNGGTSAGTGHLLKELCHPCREPHHYLAMVRRGLCQHHGVSDLPSLEHEVSGRVIDPYRGTVNAVRTWVDADEL